MGAATVGAAEPRMYAAEGKPWHADCNPILTQRARSHHLRKTTLA